MDKVKIFCEGITDQFFISDCIKLFFNIDIAKKKLKDKWEFHFANNCSIIDIGGCETFKNEVALDMLRDNTSEGGRNILFFDADFSPDSEGGKKGTGNNGFKFACQKLIDIKKTHNVEFDFYLWHNHSDDGEVEHLLHQLIPEDKKNIFSCFNNLKSCLEETLIPNIKTSNHKEELNFYLYTFNEETKLPYRNYSDERYWNLNPDLCADLFKLKSFLFQYLS
jgi:hypothetical protein